MATYTAVARTNYFRVKDTDAFRAALNAAFPNASLDVRDGGPDDPTGSVAVIEEDGHGWPRGCTEGDVPLGQTPPADDDVCEECSQRFGDHGHSIVTLIAAHLIDGDVAVIIEGGSEKSHYIVGTATAVNAAGKTRQVTLDDIYDLAKTLGSTITDASY